MALTCCHAQQGRLRRSQGRLGMWVFAPENILPNVLGMECYSYFSQGHGRDTACEKKGRVVSRRVDVTFAWNTRNGRHGGS